MLLQSDISICTKNSYKNKHVELRMQCTLIIATHNAANLLAKTLDAISMQACSGLEVLIQDGASTDDTVAIANAYQKKIPELHIESVADSGIYDAWNKALKRARGEWIFFMGTGDTFCSPSALCDTLSALKSLPQNIQYYSVPVLTVFPPDEAMDMLYPNTNPMGALRHGMCLPHQGLFHRKRLFEGRNFDPSFRIAGDYDFLCRTLSTDNFRIGKAPCVRMLLGGISSNMQHMRAREDEFWRISSRTFPKVYSWKIAARWLRAVLYNALYWVCGASVANWFADIPRLLQGKARLWSRPLPPENPLPALEEKPQVDLLVATLNRKDDLRHLLVSLREQTYRNFRIIIANQNDDAYLDNLLKDFTDMSITSLVVPSRGVSAARNALIPLSDGAIVAFPDDDCWYEADTLEQVVTIFRNHLDAGILLGRHVEATKVITKTVQALSSYDCFFESGTILQFFRREIVELTGDFDVMLGPGTGLPYGCGEDTDYVLRAHASRHTVLRTSVVRLHHPMPDFFAQSPQKIHAYAYGRLYLLRKSQMPFWFVLCNLLYPLICLPLDTQRHGLNGARYRWRMFVGRFNALFSLYFSNKQMK